VIVTYNSAAVLKGCLLSLADGFQGVRLTEVVVKVRQSVVMCRGPRRVPSPRSGFAGFRFPPEVITVAVRWYLRYGLSYRDAEQWKSCLLSAASRSTTSWSTDG
jgi:hypothetical protein